MAAKIKLTIESNFDEASRALRNFGTLTEEEAKRISAGMGKVANQNMDAFIEQNRRAGAAVTMTRGSMEGLQAANVQLERKMQMLVRNGMDPNSESLQKLKNEYIQNSDAIRRMEREQQGLNKALEMGKVAALAIGAALVAAASYGAKQWSDYSKEIANINSLIDISDSEFKSLDGTLTRLSNTFAIQKKELGAGVYQAVSAGAEDLNSALQIVEQSAILSKAALVQNTQAVDIITTAMNAYGEETMSAGKASDIYFNIIKRGKINGQQLAATIGQSITLFSAAAVSMEELGAGMSTLTKVGVPAAQATTQLNGVVNAFIKPSTAMSEALERAGYASGAALLQSKGLSGALQFLQDETGGATDKMSDLITNTQGVRGALALLTRGGEEYNEVLSTFASDEVSGAAEEALKRQTEGFAKDTFSVERSMIALQNLSIVIGEKVLPIIGRFAEFITKLATDFDSLNGPTKFLIRAIPLVTLSMGAFLLVMNIGSIVAAATVSLASLGAAFTALGAIIAANPIGAAAVAIAALGTAVTLGITSSMEKQTKAVQEWATAGTEEYRSMMRVMSEYEDLYNIPRRDRTKEERERLSALRREIESTTAGRLRWDAATQKSYVDLGHGITQNVQHYRTMSDIYEANAKRRAEVAANEAQAATLQAQEDATRAAESQRLLEAQRQAEAAASAQRVRDLQELSTIRDSLRVFDQTKNMDAFEKETFMMESQFQRQKDLLIKYHGEATEELSILEEQRMRTLSDIESRRDDEAKKRQEEAAKKSLQMLRERLYSEEALLIDNNKKMFSEFSTYFDLISSQEGMQTEERIQRLMEEHQRISELESLSREEKIQAELALSDALKGIEDAQARSSEAAAVARLDRMKFMAANVASIFGSLNTIMKNAGKESRALAVAQKAIAVAQIGIDTRAAFVKTLKEGGPYPLNVISAGLVMGSGLAAGAAAASTPIPSAETGNSFEASMSGTQRTDGSLLRVNPGERIDVTPRGEDSQRSVTANVILNDEVLWSSTQRGIDSGAITFSNSNLIGG